MGRDGDVWGRADRIGRLGHCAPPLIDAEILFRQPRPALHTHAVEDHPLSAFKTEPRLIVILVIDEAGDFGPIFLDFLD
jgi:hypothetical protein